MKTGKLSLLSVLAFVVSPTPTIGAAESLRVASAASLAGASASGNSLVPSFSSDGRSLVFLSHARNLVTNDDHAPCMNVFVRDLTLNHTRLVSVNTSGRGGGNDNSVYPAISADGRYVAFASGAGNLVTADANGTRDVFVRDLMANVTTLVSVDGTGRAGNGASTAPLVSADGRWVIFESAASNLVDNDGNGASDVFARDLTAGTTILLSRNAAGSGSGNGSSFSPAVTPSGRYVAFVSGAPDLVGGTTPSLAEIYVRDVVAGQTRWASTNVASYFAPNSYACTNVVLSEDGRFVAFKAVTPGASPVLVFHHDLETGVTVLLARDGRAATCPALSADGRFVAYESGTKVFAWDTQTGIKHLVSVSVVGGVPANGPSRDPVMSADGSKVGFLSAATDLVSNLTRGGFQLYVRDLIGETTQLVNADVSGVGNGDLCDAAAALTRDGLHVAFDSADASVVANDLNQASDVFVRNLETGITQLVSERDPALPSLTGPGASAIAANDRFYAHSSSLDDATMAAYVVSADGRLLVFSSYDGALAAGDANVWSDVFLRDLVAGTNAALSAGTNGLFSTNSASSQVAVSADSRFVFVVRRIISAGSPSTPIHTILRKDLQNGTVELVTEVEFSNSNPPPFDPFEYKGKDFRSFSISGDGNLVAFASTARASTLVSGVGDPNGVRDIFLLDMRAHTNQLISIDRLMGGTGFEEAINPLVSPDARWILFASSATEFVTNKTDGVVSLFARDLVSNTTRLVSIGPDGNPHWGYKRGATVSADSRSVAFVSLNASVLVRDLQAPASVLAATNGDSPSLSGDGQLVVFEALAAGSRNIVLKDIQSGSSNLISVNVAGTGGGNGPSSSPLLSADGRYVIFASRASDLVANDNNHTGDIFVRDRLLGTTLLVSANCQGGAGTGLSSRPVLGADGRTVIFQSYADDLVDGDFNGTRDVFVLRLSGTDSDHDGLDDEWEVAYFGDLSRDGSGDFDQDRSPDRDEFLAGTDPTNGGSVLRVLKLTSLNGGGTTLLWSAVPGRTYRVQFKDDLAQAWQELPGLITAGSTTASASDTSGQGRQRYYRVVLVSDILSL